MTGKHVGPLGRPAAMGIALLTLGVAAAPVWAGSSKRLPASETKLTECHKTLFKVAERLPVSVDYAAEKGKHPEQALLSCKNAEQVAVKGKSDYQTAPFGVGKKVKVGSVTYTMGEDSSGSLGGKPTSGPIYGWAGGGIVIYLINPTG